MAEKNENPTSGQNGSGPNRIASEKEPHAPDHAYSRKIRWKSKTVLVLVIGGLLVLGGVYYWWQSSFWEKTDDAQIDGHINPISARGGGACCPTKFKFLSTQLWGSVTM